MIVEVKEFYSEKPFRFACGETIPELNTSYETYGTLNDNKDNAILICHYFSGDKHAAGKYSEEDEVPGWWNDIIGPGKALDTDRYFIISADCLSNVGASEKITTSGPRSIDPRTNKPYAMRFPLVTIEDMVHAQKRLVDHFGIKKLKAVTGPSMGGIQALAWAALYPEMCGKVIPIAAAPRIDGFSMFFPLRMGIEAIKCDPYFNGGDYYGCENIPLQGLKNAINGLALIARGRNWSDEILGGRNFDPENPPHLKMDAMYDCEKAIIGGVAARAAMYDPNSYIYVSKANIIYDMYRELGKEATVARLPNDFLVIIEKNDIFVLPEDSKRFCNDLASSGRNVSIHEFSSPLGHLGSVTHAVLFADALSEFLESGVSHVEHEHDG